MFAVPRHEYILAGDTCAVQRYQHVVRRHSVAMFQYDRLIHIGSILCFPMCDICRRDLSMHELSGSDRIFPAETLSIKNVLSSVFRPVISILSAVATI